MLLHRTQCPKLASLQVMRRACDYSIGLHEGGHDDDPGTPAAFYAAQYKTYRRSAAYRAMVATAESRNLPMHYATDLTNVDRGIVDSLGPGARFLWGLRDCGTFLVHLDNDTQEPMTRKAAEWGLDYLGACLRLNPETTWFLWDGASLQEQSAAEARELARATLEPISLSARIA